MAAPVMRGVLQVAGAEHGRVEAQQEGRLLSECIVATKAPIMALLNAEIARAEGGAAAADAEKGALAARAGAGALARSGRMRGVLC